MRNKLIVIVALVFGLLAAFLVYNYVSNVKRSVEERVYTQVVTAIADIPANSTITDTMVTLKPFPTELMTNKEILDVNDAIGKISTVGISQGEVLLQTRLIKPGEGVERLSYKIPDGMRAMAVPVNEVSGVGSLLKVGDRVDLIATVTATSQIPDPRSTVVVQNVTVLAVGPKLVDVAATPQDKAPQTVTVAIDPQTALRLKLALDTTNVSVTLRSAADKAFVNLTPVNLNQL